MRTPSLAITAVLLAALAPGSVQAKVPEPDHIFYGQAMASGTPVTTGTVTVVTGTNLVPSASFVLSGSAGFVLRVPIDSLDPQPPGTARPGDEARVYIDGQLAATSTVGERGTATLLDAADTGKVTRTTLVSSSNPSALGAAVTFTATVEAPSPGAGTPTGSLSFKDGATTLGTQTLNGSGQATFTTAALTLGTHAIIAEYVGSVRLSPSASSALLQVIKASSVIVLATSPNPSLPTKRVILTARVRGAAPGAAIPVGSVAFRLGPALLGSAPIDGTGQATFEIAPLPKGTYTASVVYGGDSSFAGGTAMLTHQVSDVLTCTTASFSGAGSLAAGSAPQSLAIGDLNGDGKADLAVANRDSNNVTILLGDGAGSFAPAAGSPLPVGVAPLWIVAADLNLDKKLDLAVANRGSDSVSILLGTGTGTFAPAVPASSASPTALVVSDFNLDGRPDLAAMSSFGGTVTLLTGDGTGAFSAETPVSVGALPLFEAMADFNGDGRPDLAVAKPASTSVVVLLGGPGGLSAAPETPVTPFNNPNAAAVSDFDGDGAPDLAIVDSASWHVRILLGDGSGGFIEAGGSPVATGSQPRAVAVGDFDLDGKLDLVVANALSGNVTILAGNGAGGFSLVASRGVGTTPYSVAVGDFNGDGRPDLAAANSGSNNVSIQLSNCTAGTQTVVVSSRTPSALGQTVAFTATVAPVLPAAGLPGGSVTFKDAGASIGTGVLNAAGQAVVSTDTLLPGTHSIVAEYPGDANFRGSSSIPLAQVVTGLALSIGDTSEGEGDTGTTTFRFTVTLSAPSTAPVTVQFQTADGTATTADNDYAPMSGTLAFAPGERSKTFTVVVNGDPKCEPDETFAVNLSNATGGATVLRGQARAAILNDEPGCGSDPAKFYTVSPCRLVDTRNAAGALGGPVLGPRGRRNFTLTGVCGIPTTAKALSVNLTVTSATTSGFLTLFRGNALAAPSTSNINFSAGQTRANSAVVLLDGMGTLTVLNGASGTVHLILDVNGFFQ